MDEKDSSKLRANFRYIVGQIRVSDIRDYLFEKHVLTEDDYEELAPERRTERNNVRTLLQMLFKKGPRTYGIFCESLREHGYEHVVQKLETTDLANVHVESPDELDSFLKEEGKIVEFQRQLWLQAELLERYKRELDEVKKQVREEGDLKTRYKQLEEEIDKQGYSNEFVVDSLKEYMMHVQQEYDSKGRKLSPGGEKLPRAPSPMRHQSGNKDHICRIAMELSRDVVAFMTCDPENVPPIPNRYAGSMRKVVKMMTENKSSVFESFIDKLTMTEANGFDLLKNVADEMFRVGNNNWGRVVALYAFGGFVARHASDNKMTTISSYLADVLGKYVAKNLSPWMEANGGWDDFERFFTEGNEEQGGLGWTSVFLTAIGIGALVSLASVKGSM